MKIIPNQPIAFDAAYNVASDNCDCIGQPFCLPFTQKDKINFMFRVAACGEDVIENGNFEDGLAGWTDNGGWISFDDTAQHIVGQTGELQQSIPNTTGIWKIDYTVKNRTTGAVAVVLHSGIFDSLGEVRTSNGDFTDYLTATQAFNSIGFQATSDFDGQIDSVAVHHTIDQFNNDIKIFIKDIHGNIVYQIDNSIWRTIDRGYFIYKLIWDYFDLPDGCYTLCILDPCINTNNQFDTNLIDLIEFATEFGTAGTVIEYVNNGAENVKINLCIEDDGGQGSIFGVDPILVPEISYNLTFTAKFGCTDIKFRPFFGDTNGAYINADGTYNVIVKSTGEGFFGFDWESVSGDDGGCVDISDIVLRVDQSSFQCDYESNCLNIRESHDCSLEFSWWNDEDTFGFIYPLGFEFHMRLESKLWKSFQANDRNQFKFANDKRKLLFADSEKKFRLTLSEMPEYAHDAFSLGLNHDNFLIGEDHFIGDDTDYSPEWRNSSLLAPIQLDITKNLDPALTNSNC